MGGASSTLKDCLENKFNLKAETYRFGDLDHTKPIGGSSNDLITIKIKRELCNDRKNETDLKSVQAYKNIENIKLKPFYEKYFSKKDQNFKEDFIKEINQLRTNPANYAKKIEDFAMNIKTNYFSKENYFIYENCPIYLKEGEKEFIEMSKELKNSQNGNQNFSELENIEDLKIPFPYNMNEWDSIDYINDVLKKHMKNKKKYNILEFIYIKSVQNAEISVILKFDK